MTVLSRALVDVIQLITMRAYVDNEVERKATIQQWALVFAPPIWSSGFFWNSCGGTREEIICWGTGCFLHRVDTLTGTPLQSNSTRCIHSAANNTYVPPLFSLCADFINPLLIQLYLGFFWGGDHRDLILSRWVRCSDGRVFLGPGVNRVLQGNYPIWPLWCHPAASVCPNTKKF